MASVTTEMLRGGSVSFQPSGAYAQHTRLLPNLLRNGMHALPLQNGAFCFSVADTTNTSHTLSLKRPHCTSPKSTRGITGVTVVGRLVPGDEHVNVFLQQKELN